MVAFTLDVHGINPITMCVEAAEFVEALSTVEQGFDGAEKARNDLEYYAKVRSSVIANFRQASANGEDVEAPCLAALWCVFNYPEGADIVRRRVSEALRRHGNAHITMACDEKGRLPLQCLINSLR